jgi:predicted house-cleaning noncanonical NTP pyrophosphatase (MazG superfamily)
MAASIKTYNKLVRDNIPEIMKAAGKSCETRSISGDELVDALKTKLLEELAEFDEKHDAEELADMLEVVLSLASAIGLNTIELERIRQRKAERNGAFLKGIFLVSGEV